MTFKLSLNIGGSKQVDLGELGDNIAATTNIFKDSNQDPSQLAAALNDALVTVFAELEGVDANHEVVKLAKFRQPPHSRQPNPTMRVEHDEGDDLVGVECSKIDKGEGPTFWLIGARKRANNDPILAASYEFKQNPPTFSVKVYYRD